MSWADTGGGLLLDGVPGHVWIDGAEHALNTGYRTGLTFERVVRAGALRGEALERRVLELYFPVRPQNTAAALEAALWFWERGAALAAGRGAGGDGAVYAGFRARYGIDLLREEPHWWVFCALRGGLDV